MSPVRYRLCIYIPEDGILHSHRRENLKSYKMIFMLRNIECTYMIWRWFHAVKEPILIPLQV
jgi:hypothetical protein